MTGKEFLKKRGVSRTAVLLTSIVHKDATHYRFDDGAEYQRGTSGKALMLCCGKWIESSTTNSQLETTYGIVSIASVRAALKEHRLQHGHNRQYSLLNSEAQQ